MIDARGRSCPEPVLMIQKAMVSGENRYEMVVDNRVSVENVTRFAEHNGYRVQVTQEDDEYTLIMTRLNS